MKNITKWILGLAMMITAAVALSGCGGSVNVRAHGPHHHHHP